MSPEVLQLVYTVFINTINMVSTFWSGIKQNKKKKKALSQTKAAGWTLFMSNGGSVAFIHSGVRKS